MTDSVPVTADNFIRAETDKTFSGFEQGFGKFQHFRELAPIDNQVVQRGNRDTLYSMGVFDLDAGPVTISLTTIYKLNVRDVPVDGFWSISLYGPDGLFHKNDRNAYTFNDTAKKDPDGSVTIQFGGCDRTTTNCLPIVPAVHGSSLKRKRCSDPAARAV
jgi:hypothetical protein